MSTKSMISSKGDLSVKIPSLKVTFFQFLFYSRATNSDFGGWNYKSYWRSRGLDVLLADNEKDILGAWTRASLENGSTPIPRSGDFRINRPSSEDRKAHLEVDGPINEWSENTLSTRIYYNRVSLDPLDTEIKGYEIPLVEHTDGQLKLDLLGVGPRSLDFIELKQAKNNGDSPLFGMVELICYALQAHKTKGSLCSEILGTDNQSQSTQFRLILAAPENYWEEWTKAQKVESELLDARLIKLLTQFESLLAPVSSTLESKKGPSLVPRILVLRDSGNTLYPVE